MASDLPEQGALEPKRPEVDENGVDLTLVRYSLGLTPTERLKSVENFMKAMSTVRRVSVKEG